MDIDSRLKLSYYKEIATLNKDHNIYIVQHIESKKIYVKKILYHYNVDIFYQLMENPLPGFPKIFDLITLDEELIVIEEYISGETLQEIIDRKEFLSPYVLSDYIIQLCNCLYSLHSFKKPIIHRDIKPSNIIITPNNNVILIDLNAAKYVNYVKETDTTLLGTKGYAAPEQYGFGISTEKTDIYALGILIKTLINELADNSYPVTDFFQPIIEKCTYIDPNQRYNCIKDVKNDISKLPLLRIPSRVHKTEENNDVTFWKRYLPPGFRKGKLTHILPALLGYAFIFWISFTLESSSSGIETLILLRITSFLFLMAIVLISSNYMEVQSFLPFCNSNNKLVKIFGIILFDIVAVFVIVFIMAFISIFFD